MEKVSCILVAFLVGEFISEAWKILLSISWTPWTGVMTAVHYRILVPKELISYAAFHTSHILQVQMESMHAQIMQ